MTESGASRRYAGTGVSGFPVMGNLHVLAGSSSIVDPSNLPAATRGDLETALSDAIAQLETLIDQQDEMAAGILEFQQVLLEDEDLLAPIFAAIDAGQPAALAWTTGIDSEITQYRDSGDSQLMSRADDLADMRDRVLLTLTGRRVAENNLPEGAILIGQQISPSCFLGLDFDRVGGIVSLEGSPTSHVALLARARNIPMVIGIDASLDDFSPGSNAILDIQDGSLTVEPDEMLLQEFRRQQAVTEKLRKDAEDILQKPARMQNGEPVKVYVNIDHPDILDEFSADICDGVGLTRTEFLFGHGRLPDEEAQYVFYRRLVDWAAGRPVTIRTLDAGGDKPVAGVTRDGESNPFLGLRGVRLSLENSSLFMQQLRAIARAAGAGPVKLMVPMVTIPEELAQVRELLEQAVEQLEEEGVDCAMPQLGMMVEVPSAALCADQFDADFFSIGSNDLLQYVTAAARDNASVSRLANPDSPALLKLIEMTVEVARARGIEVSLCGDMASTPRCIETLMKTGLRSLSCAPGQVGYVKIALSKIQPATR